MLITKRDEIEVELMEISQYLNRTILKIRT